MPATLTPEASPSPRLRWLAIGTLVVATLVAYSNSFSGPFVFDDVAAIRDNPTIRTLGQALSPPHQAGLTVGGRPLVNLSLTLNYALSRESTWSYHAVNVLIHLGATLVLFGLLRRTLLRPLLCARFGAIAMPLALTISTLWALHPLQTESVTYVVQRAESLMGFFYLLTLYAFVRGADSPSPRPWFALCVSTCLLGMACKEVMASAPLLVLFYDRTFVAGSFRTAWWRRRGLYAALAATWLLLGWLVLGADSRGGTAGLSTSVSSWTYALTQARAIIHYLRLCFWPQPLVFDYGLNVVQSPGEVVPQAFILLALLVGTMVALWRRPALGFLGAAFFLILAPSSSVVPVVSQTVAEHRMYLPLAAVLALLVLGAHVWLGRRILLGWCAATVACGMGTWRRNEDYRSELALWQATARDQPDNARAHSNLGNALLATGRPAEAIAHYETALLLVPDYADAQNNLGRALVQSGRVAAAS